ncbi:MAG: hypothetical protein LBC84_07370, partial [Prevotellaceae bacterium]|nr:hypothetical protein [Prevotellaceae bacterium]
MKKTIFTIATIALVMGFTSCSKEQDARSKIDEGGKPTSIKVALSFPSTQPQTRATSDTNATEAEAAVKTVDVFIYTSNGTFSSHTPLTAADFNPVGSTGTSDAYE